MAPNKYTAAAESDAEKKLRSDKIVTQFDQAWELIQNPPKVFESANNAASPEDIKKQEAAQQANAQEWGAYNAKIAANPYYARVKLEHDKIMNSTAANPNAAQRDAVVKAAMKGKLEELKAGAVKSVYSDGDTLMHASDLPKFNIQLDGVSAAASSALMSSIMSGNVGSAVGNAAAAAKQSVIGALLNGVTDWVRSMGKEIFMFTGNAEDVKSLMSGLPKLFGGEGKKKTAEQSLGEFRDQQAALRLRRDGFIIDPGAPEAVPPPQTMPASNQQQPATTPALTNGIAPPGSPFPGEQPPVSQRNGPAIPGVPL